MLLPALPPVCGVNVEAQERPARFCVRREVHKCYEGPSKTKTSLAIALSRRRYDFYDIVAAGTANWQRDQFMQLH